MICLASFAAIIKRFKKKETDLGVERGLNGQHGASKHASRNEGCECSICHSLFGLILKLSHHNSSRAQLRAGTMSENESAKMQQKEKRCQVQLNPSELIRKDSKAKLSSYLALARACRFGRGAIADGEKAEAPPTRRMTTKEILQIILTAHKMRNSQLLSNKSCRGAQPACSLRPEHTARGAMCPLSFLVKKASSAALVSQRNDNHATSYERGSFCNAVRTCSQPTFRATLRVRSQHCSFAARLQECLG